MSAILIAERCPTTQGQGIITGNHVGGTVYLQPKGSATRAMAATILMRLSALTK